MDTAPSPMPAAGGLGFRALEPGDAEAWLALVVRIATAEDAAWHERASDLNEVLGSWVNPVTENTVAGFDAGRVPRAYGYVSHNDGSTTGHAFGGVDPAWQGRGIGSAVLAWQERRLRERIGPSMPDATVRSYTKEHNPAHSALLAGAGYSVVRYFSEMVRSLDVVPVFRAPDGVRIVPFTRELGEAVRAAHNEAFADHWGSEPRDAQQWGFLLDHEGFRPEWSAVALDAVAGEVAGYQLSMYDPDRFAKEGREEGYTEVLGVRRPWRGRGVARALLADAMARYKSAGLGYACLDVDTENPTGAVGLYESMGYRPLRRTLAWDKTL